MTYIYIDFTAHLMFFSEWIDSEYEPMLSCMLVIYMFFLWQT